MSKMQMNGGPGSQEQSNIAKILGQASQDLMSQSHRVLPDLAILQSLYQTFLAGGIIDDRKYLVCVSHLISIVTSLRSMFI